MEINKNSWIAKCYLNTYEELPNNLCAFFWSFIFAVYICPVAYLFRKIAGEKAGEAFGNIIVSSLSSIVIYGQLFYLIGNGKFVLLNSKVFGFELLVGMVTFLIGWLIIGLLIVIGLFYVGMTLSDFFKHLTSKNPYKQKENIVVEYIKGIKNKYCLPLKWTSDEKNDGEES